MKKQLQFYVHVTCTAKYITSAIQHLTIMLTTLFQDHLHDHVLITLSTFPTLQLLTWISLYGLIESKRSSAKSIHSAGKVKATAHGARAGPSIMQGARVTTNQQLNSMRVHGLMPRSLSAVLQTTAKAFPWIHGTQKVWSAPPSTKGNGTLGFTYQ